MLGGAAEGAFWPKSVGILLWLDMLPLYPDRPANAGAIFGANLFEAVNRKESDADFGK